MGLFSKKGADVAKHKKRSEDETGVNSDVQHDSTPDLEEEAALGSGQDETSVNSDVQHAPAEVPTPDAHAPVLFESSEQAGALPGAPERGAHDGNTGASSYRTDGEPDLAAARGASNALGTDGEPNLPLGLREGGVSPELRRRAEGESDSAYEARQASYYQAASGVGEGLSEEERKALAEQQQGKSALSNDFADDQKRSRIRQYVIERGLLSQGEVVNASDEELEKLFNDSIGRVGTVPTPELALSPAQQAQSILLSSSRGDKEALVAARSNLTAEHAAALSDEDLNAQVHAAVVNDLLREESLKAEAAAALAKQAAQDEIPFGGDAPTYYAVAAGGGGKFAHEGQSVELKPGQVVNDRSHDVEFLKRQGIKLHQIVQPNPFETL